MVAEINPPITTVAKGRCTSAPAEVETAIGKKPIAAAEAVSSTGRSLDTVPSMIKALKVLNDSLSSSL